MDVSGSTAVAACAAMAFFYVAILYSPILLRLPPPTSRETFMIRRFVCALVSSLASIVACAVLLGFRRSEDLTSVLSALGLRTDHLGEAVVFPLLLTSLLYAGTFVSKAWKLITSCDQQGSGACGYFYPLDWIHNNARNVMAWRNYVVAPITEELVFRACMIPLLLCGGFGTYTIIFFTPVFFSLAHLNHLLELYYQQGYNFMKAFLTIGLQLGYTVIFGWYASFLFLRTGHLLSPIVAHIFCNAMGLPKLSSSRTKSVATLAFIAGTVAFFWLLLPATKPNLYNEKTDSCSCWNGYCCWN